RIFLSLSSFLLLFSKIFVFSFSYLLSLTNFLTFSLSFSHSLTYLLSLLLSHFLLLSFSFRRFIESRKNSTRLVDSHACFLSHVFHFSLNSIFSLPLSSPFLSLSLSLSLS